MSLDIVKIINQPHGYDCTTKPTSVVVLEAGFFFHLRVGGAVAHWISKRRAKCAMGAHLGDQRLSGLPSSRSTHS